MDSYLTDLSNTREIQLYVQQYCSAFTVDIHEMGLNPRNLTVMALDNHSRRAIVQFKYNILCSKPKTQDHVVRHPATWWDAFKVEVLPRYPRLTKLFARWLTPAKFTVHTVKWEAKLAFPELDAMRCEYKSYLVWEKEPSLLSETL